MRMTRKFSLIVWFLIFFVAANYVMPGFWLDLDKFLTLTAGYLYVFALIRLFLFVLEMATPWKMEYAP